MMMMKIFSFFWLSVSFLDNRISKELFRTPRGPLIRFKTRGGGRRCTAGEEGK